MKIPTIPVNMIMCFSIVKPILFLLFSILLFLSKEVLLSFAMGLIFLNSSLELYKEIKNDELRRKIISKINGKNLK